GHCCAYCDSTGPLTQDHFIPLSSAKCPGTIPGNIVPACASCNSSKRARDPFSWVSGTERLDRIVSYLRGARVSVDRKSEASNLA
ncbi:MAG: HNH endonuclease, partial [Rhizobiaceae bacterium]|nr:HNH endonuclease [Rhizobiaceae bacterium]